ncbi:hypothetical protein GOC94_10160 [Sinorhizobium medicae]|nr:hypothetical protein [Sinorhizobium medicae]
MREQASATSGELTRSLRLTDTMVRVSALDGLDKVTEVLGLTKGNEGAGWMMYQDPASGQQVVFTDEDFGERWALAFAATDVGSVAKELQALGFEVKAQSKEGASFTYMVLDAGGPVVLVYES